MSWDELCQSCEAGGGRASVAGGALRCTLCFQIARTAGSFEAELAIGLELGCCAARSLQQRDLDVFVDHERDSEGEDKCPATE
jgi:hypothetical protein